MGSPPLRSARAASDTEHVRGFSPQINILFTCLAAACVVPLLGTAWFAKAVDSNDGYQGSVELMAEAVARWFTAAGATTAGADVLTRAEAALLGVAALTVLLALAMLVSPLRNSVRGVLKTLPLAAPAIVVVSILAEAHRAEVEPRWGAFATLALTVFLATSAGQAGELRERKAAPKPYTPGPGRAY